VNDYRDATLPQMPISYIDIRFSAHATEDPKKVMEAVQQILPVDYIDSIDFKRDNLRGHYGNPIILFETRIKKKEIIQAFVKNLSSNFSELDKETLLREINLHAEDGNLYLRLDKQAALQGELKLSTADPIRVRIRFKKNRVEDIIKICRELGLIPF